MKKNLNELTGRNFLEKIAVSTAALLIISAPGLLKERNNFIESAGSQKIQEKKPNIIFILSDDHRYDFLSFMKKDPAAHTPEFLATPNMDRLAEEGAVIQNTFVTTSLCSPSRASLLTGLYSHRHGVIDNDSPVPPEIVFFPEYLQKNGFETVFIGKWHMGDDSDEPRKGFDKWISFKGQGVYNDPLLNIDGKHVQRKGYITDILTAYAVDYLKQKRDSGSGAAKESGQAGKPFFLYLSHKAVHAEFIPAERHKGKYKNEKVDHPSTMANTEENFSDKPKWVKEQRNGWHGVDYMYHGELGISFDDFYKRYCETLLALDESIGNLLETLKETRLDRSTIVFYMGDNGFSLGEHGLIDKRHMYEESIRVPLLVYFPSLIKPKMRISELVQNIDIAPTILEVAGIKTPEYMDGKSFLPLLKGEKVEWRDSVFYEYFWERTFPHTPTMFGIRTNKFKYVTYHGIWDIDELYDIENDPDEKNNLINRPGHKDLIKQLNKKVYDWLESTEGMHILLKRDIGWRADKRKPHDVNAR